MIGNTASEITPIIIAVVEYEFPLDRGVKLEEVVEVESFADPQEAQNDVPGCRADPQFLQNIESS